MTSLRRTVKMILMKKIPLYFFVVLIFSVFTSHLFAEIKYKTYKKLPCKFNGVKLVGSAVPYEDSKVKKNRCCPECSSYKGKNGTTIKSISKKRGIPIVAITDMTLYEAKNWSSQYRCTIQNKSQKGQKGLKQSKKIINPITGKKQRCAYPYDNITLVFIDDKYGNFIRYYHLMSTPLVPGFSKGNCAERKFQSEIEWSEGISLPKNCGGIKYKKVKKGEVIGKMGHATATHVSLGIGSKNLSAGTDGVTRLYLIAPEDNFEWENLPTDSDAYLFPVMSKKYLKEIGYKK
ncbi:hypothetical protein PQZ72_04285 [Candidatus Pelagibacter sp.]|jgi:hypothetical protein|nr:hypothetical protein [Candidatus Pelagibacter sp.]